MSIAIQRHNVMLMMIHCCFFRCQSESGGETWCHASLRRLLWRPVAWGHWGTLPRVRALEKQYLLGKHLHLERILGEEVFQDTIGTSFSSAPGCRQFSFRHHSRKCFMLKAHYLSPLMPFLIRGANICFLTCFTNEAISSTFQWWLIEARLALL